MPHDTDVFALALHYICLFFDKGINELCLKFGTGSYTRMLPIHVMHSNIGHVMYSVIPRLHALTGCDVTSKIETKYGALNAKPVDYLTEFGQNKNFYVTKKQKKQRHTLLKF